MFWWGLSLKEEFRFFKGRRFICCWRESGGQRVLGRQGLGLAASVWVCATRFGWGSSLQGSLSAAHQPGLGCCSASALGMCSAQLCCNLKGHWSALDRPCPAGSTRKTAHSRLFPFSHSLLMIICAFSMGQLCLCVPKPLYHVCFQVVVVWHHSRESLSVWCLHTPPGRTALFSGDVSGNVTFPKWSVKLIIIHE